jgi:hypothetical protein
METQMRLFLLIAALMICRTILFASGIDPDSNIVRATINNTEGTLILLMSVAAVWDIYESYRGKK